MVDQTSQFYAILTKVGAAKQANADALGIPWKITQMAVGDANPRRLDNPPLPQPDASWTSLLGEWRRAPLNQLKVDERDSAVIVAEQVIPAEIGGRWIREVGLYDADGDLVAVANCPPTYKPLLSQGSGRTQVVRMNLVVSSSSNVVLKIDPSVVLATREWVTEELARQDFKHSVLAATTAAISLSGLQTVDGVALTAGARVLVKNQAAAKDNGLYLVAAGGAWTRCPDADSSAKVTPGLLVLVERGTANGDSAWQLITDAPITLGVTALAFEMAFGRSGVSTGTYRSVTVDTYGRVVAATNPTTVAGYGLTDVYTKTQIDQALAGKAPLRDPVFTGDPKAPTPPVMDNDTSISTTAFVRNLMARYGLGAASADDVITNIDAIRETGVYMVTGNTAGTKPEYPPQLGTGVIPNGTLLHLERWSNNMGTQLWDTLVTSANPIYFMRTRNTNGVWSQWGELLTSARIATQAQVDSSSADNVLVTPKTLRSGFARLLSGNGYIAFPTWLGGLIIQWGGISTASAASIVAPLPIEYPNAHMFALAGHISPSGAVAVSVTALLKSTIQLNTPGVGSTTMRYLSIGH
ncbi:MAG: phage tail protein [Pseudomonas palmensis]|uniref:phage tail-collar fiber domain-containing protein n=1 Tax=Pseudomonas palmensis TaxID=2815362 RepID=UPI003D1231E6